MTDPMIKLSEAVKFSIEIHDLKTELDQVPVKVREVESELGKILEEYQSKKTEHDKLAEEKSQLERAIQEESDNLEKKEKRLNAIKTQKEYQAVVSEITTAKTANRQREEKIAELGKQIEEFGQELEPLEAKLKNLEEQLGKEKSDISGTLSDFESKIKALESKLEDSLKALPGDVRDQYQRIERQKQPPAALVIGGTCQACFMAIPPQMFIEIQKGHEIHTCPTCHRLLYLGQED